MALANTKTEMELTATLYHLNEQLRKSEQLRDDFISNVKNEMNNPMTAVLNFAKILRENKDLNPAQIADMARMIYNEAFQLNFQLNNILMAAELEAGSIKVETTTNNISDILNNRFEAFNESVITKKIIIETEHQTIESFTDRRLFAIMADNLISNAIEFNNLGGYIKSKLWVDDNENINWRIENSGMGFSPSDSGVIFNRFRQVSYGDTKPHKGNGLGLAVTREVAQLLGGEIKADSQLGEYAAFQLQLPLTTNQAPDWSDNGFNTAFEVF